MKKLYAPWRAQYVQSILGENQGAPRCVFCDHYADANDAQHFILKRGIHAGIVMNIYPYSSGHLMVIPYKHINDLSLLSPEARAECMELINSSNEALKKIINPEGFNVGINIGKAAGAGIPSHLHFHSVPRWIGDTNFMPVIAETKTISVDLTQLYNQLLEELKKQS